MTSKNPLSAGNVTSGTTTREARPGDIVTIYDSKNERSLTFTRTTRPYVEDLVECYNNHMEPDAERRGLRWMVSHTGAAFLGYPEQFSVRLTREMGIERERERREWVRAYKARQRAQESEFEHAA